MPRYEFEFKQTISFIADDVQQAREIFDEMTVIGEYEMEYEEGELELIGIKEVPDAKIFT